MHHLKYGGQFESGALLEIMTIYYYGFNMDFNDINRIFVVKLIHELI
jgi:hypothetical protein